MSNQSNFSRIIVTSEIYEQYAQKCKLPKQKVTLRCILLQLGYDPSMVSVQVNGEFLNGFESVLVQQDQEIVILPMIAGG